MRWVDIESTLDTGDILLFKNPHYLGSREVAAVVRDPYSHMGIVVREAGKTPYLFQATTRGVVIDPLPAYLAGWRADEFGNVVVRHLQVERTPAMMHALEDFISEVYGRPFIGGQLAMLLHWAAGNVGLDLGEKKFFCAQLAAETLKRMGVLALQPVSNKYSERDFCQEHEDVHLLGGATLSDEIAIVLTKEEMDAARAMPLPIPVEGSPASRVTIDP